MALDKLYEEEPLMTKSGETDVVRRGYLRKLKNKKRKYFVLYNFSENGRGRLECYTSEKKFKEKSSPGKIVFMSDVFNVMETQHKETDVTFTIFLKDEKFGLVAGNSEEKSNWIEAFDFVRNQGKMLGALPKYEFIWKISIKNEGIARGSALAGAHRLGKMGNTLAILDQNTETCQEEIRISNVRRSGQAESFVLLEIGRSHRLGPGELWIEVTDKQTAKAMHSIIFGESLVRPRSYFGFGHQMSTTQTMTIRRRSDGADKVKPNKKSFLPFLRSKLKETESYASKEFALKSKRSNSAADIHKIGITEDDKIYEKFFDAAKFQGTTNSSYSVQNKSKDSGSLKKSKRLSLFRSKKHSISVQDLHNVETTNDATKNHLTNMLSLNSEYTLSKSAQNIHENTNGSSNHSSRLQNIRKLSLMQSNSASDIYMARFSEKDFASDSDGYERVVPNGRPVTMEFDEMSIAMTPVLRKNKWRSLDDNLKDNSTQPWDSASVGTNESSGSDSFYFSPSRDRDSLREPIADDGYVRMNYNNAEDKGTLEKQIVKNNVYMMIKPDPRMQHDQEEPESYMDMSPVNHLDTNDVLHANRTEKPESTFNALDYGDLKSSRDCSVNIDQHAVSDPDKVCKKDLHRKLTSQNSAGETEKTSNTSPTSPEKRGISKLREFRKQMTLNWKPAKTLASPKKRFSEATSHFYVDNIPDVDPSSTSLTSRITSSPKFRSNDRNSGDELTPSEISQTDRSARPSYLNLRNNELLQTEPGCLSPVAENDVEIEKSFNNIYTTVGENEDVDGDHLINYSGSRLTSESDSISVQDLQSKYQSHTNAGKNYERVYTEVTLKEKEHIEMPSAKGQGIVNNNRAKKMNSSNDNCKTSRTTEGHRKISQKILSSPTSEAKGYQNISLRENLITTPLEEVEGRPYVNLGFHSDKATRSKKSAAEKRSSADASAMQQLMALQNERRMSNEISDRKKSNAEKNDDINQSLNNRMSRSSVDEDEEVSYVNVDRNPRQENNGESDYVNVVTMDSGQSINANNRTYENVHSHERAKDVDSTTSLSHVQDSENVNIRMKIRQSPTSKQRACTDDLYANIGLHGTASTCHTEIKDSKSKVGKEKQKPTPAPKPKKPPRRKVAMNEHAAGSAKSDAHFEDFSLTPKQSNNNNESPNTSPERNLLENVPDDECSYVNVGAYRDNFDANSSNLASSTKAKSRSYENLFDDFSGRKPKKSIDSSLAYAQIDILSNIKDNTVVTLDENSHYAELNLNEIPDSALSNSGNSRNSPDLRDSPRSKRYAYTEVDFMKSHGISEAVREQRSESTDSTEHECQI